MIHHKKLISGSILISVILILSLVTNYSALSSYGPTSSSFVDTVKANSIKIGDIDMAYKIFGTGSPLLLIMGSGRTMDDWKPILLKELSSKHTVVVFDNRGMGGTTPGTKKFTIKQFSEDTAELLEALKINRTDVLGSSMGGMIAQELSLNHPDKVGKLIIVSSDCGGHQSIPNSAKIIQAEYEKALSESNIATSPEDVLLRALLYPEQWRKQNLNYLEKNPLRISNIETFTRQFQAVENWEGVCDELKKIEHPTLVISGTEDIVVPPANSLILTEGIPKGWLVQIKGAGHGVLGQYPEKLSEIILSFLESSFK